MSVPYYGDFAEDDTVNIPFNTFSSDDPSASVTITDLADADIKVHKDGGTTEIATDGATVAIDFDSRTGAHLITVDTSAHSDYSTGSEYAVLVEGTTVDGATITAWVGAFSIERAGGTIALLKLIQAAVITNAAGTDIAADIIAVKAETATIVADTGELQVDDYPTSIAAVQTTADAIEAAVITNAAGTDIAADIIAVKAETASILADTDDIGVAGAGLTAIPYNSDWDAEIQSECADALTAYDPPTKAETDALLTTALTESYAADGAAPTLTQAIYAIQQFLQEKSVASTTLTVKKLDGSTGAMTFTLDDDTNPTSITRAT